MRSDTDSIGHESDCTRTRLHTDPITHRLDCAPMRLRTDPITHRLFSYPTLHGLEIFQTNTVYTVTSRRLSSKKVGHIFVRGDIVDSKFIQPILYNPLHDRFFNHNNNYRIQQYNYRIQQYNTIIELARSFQEGKGEERIRVALRKYINT